MKMVTPKSMSKINCNRKGSSSGCQMDEMSGGATQLPEHTQYDAIRHGSRYHDGFPEDQRPYPIQNEARKRIDAALGLLKLKNTQNYL